MGAKGKLAPPEGGAEIDHRRTPPESAAGAHIRPGDCASPCDDKKLQEDNKDFDSHGQRHRKHADGCQSSSDVPFQQCAGSDTSDEHSCSRPSTILTTTTFLGHK